MSRPSKYKSEFIQQAAKLCKNGATDRELAEYFEVSESTLNLWKVKHQGFSESIKVSKSVADERVVASLYRKAVGFSAEDVHISNYQGDITITPIVKNYPPDATAAIFWLKNRQPKEWRDVKAIEHSGSIGDKPLEEMTDAELAGQLAEIRKLIAGDNSKKAGKGKSARVLN